MPEFGLIQRLQECIGRPGGGVSLGIGDDAAVLDLPPGQQLVACSDTLVEGIHFEPSVDPRSLGHKSLAVNLSDLAAMGADPAWFLLALTLAEDDASWVDRFAEGMAAAALESGAYLVGGDTTQGNLSITVTALGLVRPGEVLTRRGARPGDRIYVSGEPGRAAFALQCRQSGGEVPAACAAALDFPVPRIGLGRALRGVASACIDISDGLAADLGHVLGQSGVGAELALERLPVPRDLAGLEDKERWQLQLTGGDDYELCFSVPESRIETLERLASQTQVAVHEIGRVTDGKRLRLSGPGHRPFELLHEGYEHFSPDGGASA